MFILLLTACLGAATCDEVDPLAVLPERLSDAGLYTDLQALIVADDVVSYTPNFPLWSDGAEKHRWIRLPGPVDTSNADSWDFPVGTRLFKEFRVEGEPVETRVLDRYGTGSGDWAAVAYVWSGDDAFASLPGEVDAGGTAHDVPAAADCEACHGGRQSRVLGVSAVQLPADGDGLTLATLPATAPVQPVVLPGNATARAAVGYLHANCSHCHNDQRPASDGARCYDPRNDLDFHLPAAGAASVGDLPVAQTVFDHGIQPGHADESEVVKRMSTRGSWRFAQMPPIATEQVDEDGLAAVRAWIDAL